MATPDKRPPAWAETSVAAPMEITAETILAEFRSTKGPTPEFQGELQSRIVTAVLLNQEAESLELRAATELLLDVTIPKRVHVRLLNLGGGVGDVLVRSRLSPDGPTVVHNAAYHGYLDHIPNLNVELLLMPEGRRAMSAPVMVAAGKRHLATVALLVDGLAVAPTSCHPKRELAGHKAHSQPYAKAVTRRQCNHTESKVSRLGLLRISC